MTILGREIDGEVVLFQGEDHAYGSGRNDQEAIIA